MRTETVAPPRRGSHRPVVALLAAGALAIGASVALAAGVPDLLGHDQGPALAITLRAPRGTSAGAMAEVRRVSIGRLRGIAGVTADVRGTDLRLLLPGVDGAAPPARLERALTAPDHLEEREVLETIDPAGPLTACPEPGAAALGCPPAAGVQCPSSVSAGCTDADLSGREVTLLGTDGQEAFRLGPVLITGGDVAGAGATLPPPAIVADVRVPQWQVQFTLTPAATARYAALTRGLVGRRLAIVVDRGVVTAPELQSAITDGRTEITGRYTEREARDLAAALAAGELPVAVSVAGARAVAAHHVAGSVGLPLVIGVVCLAGLAVVGARMLLVRSSSREVRAEGR